MFSTELAQPHDLEALLTMMEEFYNESGYSLEHREAARSFSVLLSHSSLGCIWIARANRVPIGYLVMTRRFSMEYGGIIVDIDDLFVRKKWRGQGAGKLLIANLFEYCKAHAILAVRVEVGAGNLAAINLYHQFGLFPHEDDRHTLAGKVGGDERFR